MNDCSFIFLRNPKCKPRGARQKMCGHPFRRRSPASRKQCDRLPEFAPICALGRVAGGGRGPCARCGTNQASLRPIVPMVRCRCVAPAAILSAPIRAKSPASWKIRKAGRCIVKNCRREGSEAHAPRPPEIVRALPRSMQGAGTEGGGLTGRQNKKICPFNAWCLAWTEFPPPSCAQDSRSRRKQHAYAQSSMRVRCCRIGDSRWKNYCFGICRDTREPTRLRPLP